MQQTHLTNSYRNPLDPIRHEPEIVKALEVLHFDQVELEKNKEDGSTSFASLGTLNILYFDYYERFILQVNDWKYALLPRIPTTAVGEETDDSQIYNIPAYDGTYTLKINSLRNRAALQNLDTILAKSSRFARVPKPVVVPEPVVVPVQQEVVQINTVVDNPIAITSTMYQQDLGGLVPGIQQQGFVDGIIMDTMVIGQTQEVLPAAVQQRYPLETQTQTLAGIPAINAQSVYVGQSGQPVASNLKSPAVGTSSYKKSSGRREKMKSSMKKLFHKDKRARQNVALSQPMDFMSIKMTSETSVPVHQFKRIEIEEVLVGTRVVIKKLEHKPETVKEEIKEKIEDVVDIVKDGLHDIKDKNPYCFIKKIILTFLIVGKAHEQNENGEKIGKVALAKDIFGIVKDGVVDMKDKLAHREYEGADGEVHKVGLMDLVKEGVHELKEKIGSKLAKGHEDQVVEETEQKKFIEVIGPDGVPVLQEVITIQEKVFARSGHEKLRIFDDRYINEPVGVQPYTFVDTVDPNIHYIQGANSVPIVATTLYNSDNVYYTGELENHHQTGAVGQSTSGENHDAGSQSTENARGILLGKAGSHGIKHMAGGGHQSAKTPAMPGKAGLAKTILPMYLASHGLGKGKGDGHGGALEGLAGFAQPVIDKFTKGGYQVDKSSLPQQSFMGKVKAMLPFGHGEDANIKDEHPIERINHPEGSVDPQPTMIDKVKASLPFGEKSAHKETPLHADSHVETEKPHEPSLMDKVKASIPIIREKIESTLRGKADSKEAGPELVFERKEIHEVTNLAPAENPTFIAANQYEPNIYINAEPVHQQGIFIQDNSIVGAEGFVNAMPVADGLIAGQVYSTLPEQTGYVVDQRNTEIIQDSQIQVQLIQDNIYHYQA